MKHYAATTTINAPQAEVWKVLSDGAGYTSWPSSVIGFEGTIADGNTIKLTSEVNPKRGFKLKVSDVDAPNKFVFSSGMPLGLFKGERTYTLTPKGDATEFSMREEYSGPMAGMIVKSIPDLQPSFEKFAAGLKAKAEGK